jgi:hypothetical protein
VDKRPKSPIFALTDFGKRVKSRFQLNGEKANDSLRFRRNGTLNAVFS